jgi:hypothetical protein
MAAEQVSNISVIDPITPAVERVKVILFKPFDLKKWFVIGFCAWLAYLGKGGGGGGGGHGGSRGGQPSDIQGALIQAKEFILDNSYWIVPVAVIVFAVGIAIWLIFTWLSSRGQFMFLHCVAQNKAEVKIPWDKFRQHANSLFAFRIALGLIAFAVIALLLVIIGFLIAAMVSAGAPSIGPICGIVITILAVIVISIVLSLIKKFTMDFVVAIMFLRITSCTSAWREFLALFSANKGRFTLYVLFQILIAIVIGVIIMAAVCLTCCIAGCIMAIPYIGTVLLLPILVFSRSYSLLYFQQYGSQFDVFIPEVETT